jgi:hypothetical protein
MLVAVVTDPRVGYFDSGHTSSAIVPAGEPRKVGARSFFTSGQAAQRLLP